MNLYRVERSTSPPRKRSVWVHVFHACAPTPEEAIAKAQAREPQDHFDGPTVEWSAELVEDGIASKGTLFRSKS
jgi:hypothetical protein